MREPVRDRDRLEHIVEAIDRILGNTGLKSRDELEADNLRYYGIVKSIEIIGEAAYKLTRSFCREHAETPWEFIAKMRHVLVHDYYQIDPDAVWKVIQEDLPLLREQVSRYLSDTDWEKWEHNAMVISESAAHKSLVQTAERMKLRGYDTEEIYKITGLGRDEIEAL
ncbi:DUF86 domain-containing protein [Prevotella sp. E9-3]|uniref:HepT-like ribonuclease domain-containing protein n=1 Tax=Prevotella sp. E9-3 TaxID=2913621 RepID=UPI001EDC231F|nr:HepT-like ribonuclease domain-containing protein [Prevotella sp. E9-3]UKK48080.1 DUF86 domain-containing protein [Prevotella sp. E9-3]